MPKENKGEKKLDFSLEKAQVLIGSIEEDLESLKKLLFNNSLRSEIKLSNKLDEKSSNNQIIEGVFNGEEMIDNIGKSYQVSPNYASKSKLVPGDVMKLTILDDGTFIYKQIGPVERKNAVGELIEKNGKYLVKVGNKNYNVLQASITYFKATVGDKVTIIIPKDRESNWAALENIIKD